MFSVSEEAVIDELMAELRATGRCAPVPSRWGGWFKELTKGHSEETWPPLPLILAAHWGSTASEKSARLEGHLRWAAAKGKLDSAINTLRTIPTSEWNVENPETWSTRPVLFGEDYRWGWTADPAAKLSRKERAALIQLLKSRWLQIAGDAVAAVCFPYQLSGAKGRRLLVRGHDESGSQAFSRLLDGRSNRGAFAAFRRSVNSAIPPHRVDHIAFSSGPHGSPHR